MNIIYFTTAQDNTDYESFIQIWKKKPNPSNQNFHNKLIRAISLSHHVDVISFRPFSRSNTTLKSLEKQEKVLTNIHWHYAPIKTNRITRILKELSYSTKIMKNIDKDSVIFTDTINPIVLLAAVRAGKRFKLPVVGIVTDSPSNIAGTGKNYTKFLLSSAKHLSGYIALTTELEEMFNQPNSPSLIFEGIVDNFAVEQPIKLDKPYFFFGGALLPKYGVYNLINAFNSLNRDDIKLIICGHHGDISKITSAIKDNKNIEFLNTLPVKKVIEYELGALACINPRPYSEDLDRYSIPSKTLEYLSSGNPTISVRNTKLQKFFYNDAIWAKSGSVEDLKKAMENLLNLSVEDRILLGKTAKNKAENMFSLTSINKKIDQLLNRIK